jgi:hypothetical protein
LREQLTVHATQVGLENEPEWNVAAQRRGWLERRRLTRCARRNPQEPTQQAQRNRSLRTGGAHGPPKGSPAQLPAAHTAGDGMAQSSIGHG